MLRIAHSTKSSLPYVPLQQINIESTIRSFAADVKITQIFRHDGCDSIEAIYCFPIEEQAAIYSFTAHIDNREIVAQLREKIHETYPACHSTPVSSKTAFLLEQNEASQDTFIINVGTLPPSKECIISISYVTELDLIQGSIIRFVIPTAIAPRYCPCQHSTISSRSQTLSYVQYKPYSIEFRCHIDKLYGPNQQEYIARLTSSSHHIDIDLSERDAYVVRFAQKNTYLDRDILLDIVLSDKRANTFVIVESDAAMAAVMPFDEDCYLTLNNKQTNEFIFILDCSGSMKIDDKIGLIREAMLFFIRNLPADCYFNIIKFGAKYSCLFNEPTAFYTRVNVCIAEKFIHKIQPDLGGTEILTPLQWLERHPPKPDRVRQVFFLTDGAVSNVSEVLEQCRSMIPSTRFFSFGLGASPSRSLIKGLARTTNGRFVFIPPNTNIDGYISEQLRSALRRCITNIRVQWNLGIPIQSIPSQLSSAHVNDRLIVYALAKDRNIELNDKASIAIQTDQSYYHLGIKKSDRITSNTQVIARLAAKALIIELEHCKRPQKHSRQISFVNDDHTTADYEIIPTKDDIKRHIIELSLKYNILSPYTVFVGIEKHLSHCHADMVSRVIPIQVSAFSQKYRSNDSDLIIAPFDREIPGSNRPKMSSTRTSIHIERPRENSTTALCTSVNNHRMGCYEIHEYIERIENESSSTNERLTTNKERTTSSLSNKCIFDICHQPNEGIHINNSRHRSICDKEIVYRLLNQQNDDGLWCLASSSSTLRDLTGKPFSAFQFSCKYNNPQILATAIIIILFQSRFVSLKTIWDAASEKALQRLMTLLNNDWNELVVLLKSIRVMLNA